MHTNQLVSGWDLSKISDYKNVWLDNSSNLVVRLTERWQEIYSNYIKKQDDMLRNLGLNDLADVDISKVDMYWNLLLSFYELMTIFWWDNFKWWDLFDYINFDDEINWCTSWVNEKVKRIIN